MKKNGTFAGLVCVIISLFCLAGGVAYGAETGMTGKKVLVVNSYHSTSSAELKIQEGIDSVLKGAELKYFFMDTKKNPGNGPAKAAEAFAIYNSFKPDAVITTDDNAQSMFVLPYLKDKVDTPIIFCGVNDDATQYGYPNDHITGVLEKKHYREGLNFAKLIVPKINKIAVIYKDNPSNTSNIGQIKREMANYPVRIVTFLSIKSTTELRAVLAGLEDKVDALLALNLAGIEDEDGTKLNTNDCMGLVSKIWPKPTIGASKREIQAGLLCAVAKLNVEQGLLAGGMVRDIFNGKDVKEISVTQNRNGQRMINVTTARRLGVDLKPLVLVGTSLLQ